MIPKCSRRAWGRNFRACKSADQRQCPKRPWERDLMQLFGPYGKVGIVDAGGRRVQCAAKDQEVQYGLGPARGERDSLTRRDSQIAVNTRQQVA